MPEIQTTKPVEFSTTKSIEFSFDSSTQGTFQGPKFRVLREQGHIVVYYDASIYVHKCIGDTGIILYHRHVQYKTNFDVVSESESQILYHKDNLMICVTEQHIGTTCLAYYVIMADKFCPINNLYVNTESR